MIAKLLVACVSWSWWIETTFTSAILFGEYEYPRPKVNGQISNILTIHTHLNINY